MSDVIQINATATLEVVALQEDGVSRLDLSTITPAADNLIIVANGPQGQILVFDGAGTGGSTAPVVFETDGSDGVFHVVTNPGDITIEGPWMYQGYAKTPAGQEYRSPKLNFEAEDNLPTS